MAVERVSGGSSLIDVLDRVLDKGIVIDAGLVSRPQLGPGEEEEVTTVETTRRPVRTRRSAARI